MEVRNSSTQRGFQKRCHCMPFPAQTKADCSEAQSHTQPECIRLSTDCPLHGEMWARCRSLRVALHVLYLVPSMYPRHQAQKTATFAVKHFVPQLPPDQETLCGDVN